MRRVILLVLIAGMAGCRKEAPGVSRGIVSPGFDQTSRMEKVALPATQAVNAAAEPKDATRVSGDPMRRMIIRSASLSMIVDDTAATMDKLTLAAESAGGYVSDSRVWRDGEQLRGTVSLRIPAVRLTTTLASIRRMAVRIQSETLGSQEVTQEYVDLQSQLRNMEAAESELRQLMTSIRQNSKRASEVLEMYQQLASIRGQIEQTKGRMRYLDDMTALASVNVDLVPNALAKPVVEAGWQPLVVVRNATRSLVSALQGLATAAIWFAIYLLPIILMVSVAVYVVRKVVARLMRRSESAV